MYLLDTNIISETRKPRPHPAVLNWIQSVPVRNLFLASISVGELQKGVEIVRSQNLPKANEIESWIDLLASVFEILPATDLIFREWARLMRGRSDEKWEDGLIAATARVHRLIVVTRNGKDFSKFEVEILNPFPISPGGKI